MIVTVYRHAQAYTVSSEAVLRVAAVGQFQSAWGEGDLAYSSAIGFALEQPVLVQEPNVLLGGGRLSGIDLPEEDEVMPPPMHLVLLRSCDGDIRHAVWADRLDWSLA